MKGDRLALCGKLWAACLVLLVSATATQAACPWTTYDQTFASWRATATPDQEGAYRVTGVRLLMQGPTVDLSAYSLKLYNNGVIVFADQSVTLSVNNIIIESGDPGLSSPTGQYSTSQLGPAGNNNTSPYGNRVIAVGAGGTLSLRGSKGVGRLGGVSWTHLATTAESPTTIMTFTSAVDWVGGDKVVMATSDFEPEHSEEVTISTTTLQGWVGYMLPPPRYSHFGERLDYSRSVDIRSEVALLTRNIRIESAPNSVNPSYGAHTIFRRGFTSVQVEGVEFADLGQGGFIMRYPIHFHMVVDAAPNTFVRDCSINRSWNRWVVLHGTRRVTIQRNVGYMSYGHGFYLEDGYETNNIFDANIGITAKPAMQNAFWNPNNVPSIIESDQSTPSIFWITNAYNTFTNNAAVGATACGRCYWFVGRNGNGPSAEVPELANAPFANGQRAPIYKFKGNSAHACFLGIDTIPPLNAGNDCATVVSAGVLKPLPHNTPDSSWRSDQTGFTFITPTVDGGVNDNYAIGIIDSATVYRNRGSPLYSAVWLRPYWWWMRNSAILDNNMGGVTMVSGGDPSGVVEGYWGASTNTIYVGFSKWGDQWMPYGNNTDGVNERPFNPETGSTYPGGLFAERRGHQFYDGPAHISKCEFHSFNPRLSSPRVNAPITGAHVVRNNTAIGWFMPNVFLYPAAFTSEHLLFNDTSIRHFVVGPRIAEAFFFPTPEAVLRDGDKQTFLHDLDGTLTGFADSTSINNYEFHRGPVWQVECLSAETCITSPYSYVNAHVIVQDVAPRTITATRAWDNAQSPLPNLIGIQTNNVRQWFLLAMKSGSYHLDFAPPLPSSLPLFVRLMYSYATNDYVEFSICANGLNPALMTVQYGQMTNHYNGDPAAAFTASAANPVEWAYDPAVGRLTVKVVNHQPKNDHCYPSGACKLNQATGKCVYNAAVASVTNCADNIAECDEVCAKYGNTYPECPEGGCPTVRIDFGHQSSATATCTGRPQRCLGSQLAGVRLQGTDVDVDPAQPSQCTGQCDSTIHYDPPPSGCAWSSGGTCDAAP